MNKPRAAYTKNQIIANLLINSGLNGIIAFIFYRSRSVIPLNEIAVDIQITVAIIAFFVSWIAISAVRKNFSVQTPGQSRSGAAGLPIPLPARAALRSLVITAVLMLVYGGLLLTGFLAVVQPHGMDHWGYIIFKTLYTGGCAACAAALAILSVFKEMSE